MQSGRVKLSYSLTGQASGSRYMVQHRRLPWLALALAILTGCAGAISAREPGNRWLPDRIGADSVGYEYEATPPVSDGYRKPQHWRETWASRETHHEPHWLEFGFEAPVPVEAVAIHWAVEDGHPKTSGDPTTSRAYRIQAWQENEYRDLVEISDATPAARSIHTFDRVSTDRVRVWQPAGGGPAARTNVMWIAELEVYDYPKAETDFGTPADDAEVRRVRQTVRERTVGIYRRERYWGQGQTMSAARPLQQQGWRTIGLDHLDERELERCGIVVLAGARHFPNRENLLAFLHNGGRVLFIHDACGRGGGGSLLPAVWEFEGMGEGELRPVGADHPIAAGIEEPFSSSFGDHARLRAGRRGQALIRDEAGYDVVVAGRVGRGRAVAIGIGQTRDLQDVEKKLLIQSVEWLRLDDGAPVDLGRRSWGLRQDLRRLRNRYRPIFEDVTEEAGIVYYGYSKGVMMADINHNGRLDVFATINNIPTADPYHNLLFRNDGDWQFTEIAAEAGVTRPPGIGCVFGDVNGNGAPDLFVGFSVEMGSAGYGKLYLNDGKGGFRDATAESGLGDIGRTALAMMADVNNNGHLDLYVTGSAEDNKLFINRGDGTFEDRTEAFGLAGLGTAGERGYVGAAAAVLTDLDHSGFVDLVAFSKGRMHVFRNDEGRRFVEVADYMGPDGKTIEGASLGIAVGDFNNNGLQDLFVGGPNVLLRNDGNLRFTDITAEAGLEAPLRGVRPYGSKFVDWNNSGHLDLFVATGCWAFENNGDGTFSEVTAELGLDVYGVHGFNFGDLDGDGDLDFYGTSWAKHPFVLLRNNLDDGNSLTIRVRGARSNTSGVGAKIWVYDQNKSGPDRRLRGYREVRAGGGSMYSGGILQQHVGVGSGGGPYTVETLFPASGERVVVSNIVPHATVLIQEPQE